MLPSDSTVTRGFAYSVPQRVQTPKCTSMPCTDLSSRFPTSTPPQTGHVVGSNSTAPSRPKWGAPSCDPWMMTLRCAACRALDGHHATRTGALGRDGGPASTATRAGSVADGHWVLQRALTPTSQMHTFDCVARHHFPGAASGGPAARYRLDERSRNRLSSSRISRLRV